MGCPPVTSALLLLLLFVSPLSHGGDARFESEVMPILEARCFECHDGATLKGGVGLDRHYYASLPTDAGERLFVAGRPEDSVLFRVVTETDPEKRMPPKGEPLFPAEVAAIRSWIERGAVWPDDGWRPPRHWSFVAPERPELPPAHAMLDGRRANEIDRFIAAHLAAEGLALNPEAEPARLIRRLHLDLTGLPPSVEEVDAFLSDPSFERYAAEVDRLLESPAFGEKWAVSWLDLARYADSEGYQRDSPRSMWPYRDWVIRALNRDMPFDRFTIEQLAGDLLPEPDESQLVATGFHRNAPMNLEAGTDPAEDHYKRNVDRVNTTGTIWLGLTVGCAQCHNHKYDPISAQEYYELYAFFNNGPMESRQQGEQMGMSTMVHIGPEIEVTRSAADIAHEKKLQAELTRSLASIEEELLEKVETKVAGLPHGRADLPVEVRKILDRGKPMTAVQCRTVMRQINPGDAPMSLRIEKAVIEEERLAAVRKKTVRVMRDLEEPRSTRIAKRGDFLSPGEEVSPATPASLHPFSPEWPRNRLGLARWLVDPANPLVGRTFVNRLWIDIFGQGIVITPEDFGSEGEHPTHPELLDWLAVTFVEDDAWSLKRTLRRIALSATYRQSIRIRPDAALIDPRNQLLWRHPGHRFRAETIRDQALAISGLLSERRYGATVRPYQPASFWRKTAGAGEDYWVPSTGEDAYRRGVYTMWRRNAHYPSFANFDAPDRSACVVQRETSNTPLQALTLLNDPVYVEAADSFAARIARDGGDSVEGRLSWAFRTALARTPGFDEQQVLHSAYLAVLGDTGSEHEALVEVATILLNLHETITRN